MAVQKKRVTKKTKKEIVKKQKTHKAVIPEIQQDVPKAEQTPVLESIGGPVVIPSGVMQDTSKEQSESKPELTEVEQSQGADTVLSQPEPAISTPSTETTQGPFAVDGVVRDKKDEEDIEEPKKKKSWVIIAIIVISIIFIGGALWYFRENASNQVSLEDEITSTPSPSRVSPTPASDSAKLAIDHSKYKIKVLNGSGIGGEAAKGKAILETEKFVIEEIGNAETSDYEKTVIQAKKGVDKAFLDKLKSVLGETYLLGSNEMLEDSEEVDVVIIIGSGKQP